MGGKFLILFFRFQQGTLAPPRYDMETFPVLAEKRKGVELERGYGQRSSIVARAY